MATHHVNLVVAVILIITTQQKASVCRLTITLRVHGRNKHLGHVPVEETK